MQERRLRFVVWATMLLATSPRVVSAQGPAPSDETIDTIRRLGTIGEGDQRRIRSWIDAEVVKAGAPAQEDPNAAFNTLRSRLLGQYNHTGNTEAFRKELVAQTAASAATAFGQPGTAPVVARALARVLLDMDPTQPEAFDGLLAGLGSKDAGARYLCVKGLIAQKAAIASDDAKLEKTVNALRDAGLTESDPVVLSRIYQALAFANHVDAVFDTYIALFERRLKQRRGETVFADAAEIEAFEFFRQRPVASALNSAQKVKLATALAVFLRVDALRYNVPNIDYREKATLEARLAGNEACLVALGAGEGGDVRGRLGKPADVLAEVYRWVGNEETNTKGALNSDPWNVPVGAP